MVSRFAFDPHPRPRALSFESAVPAESGCDWVYVDVFEELCSLGALIVSALDERVGCAWGWISHEHSYTP